jgi:hypothetical protein
MAAKTTSRNVTSEIAFLARALKAPASPPAKPWKTSTSTTNAPSNGKPSTTWAPWTSPPPAKTSSS